MKFSRTLVNSFYLCAIMGASVMPPANAQTLLASQDFDALDDSGTFTLDSLPDGGSLTNAGASNSGGPGIGFFTTWSDTREEGAGPVTPTNDSNDFIGVNSFTGSNAPNVAADGSDVSSGAQHNFQFNDGDGALSLLFEPVDVSGSVGRQLRVDYWINDTGFESDDSLVMAVSDGTNLFTFVDFSEPELEGNASADDGSPNWRRASVDLDDLIDNRGFGTMLELVVRVDTNSSSENVFVDNVVFESGVEPPAVVVTPIYEIQGNNHLSPLAGDEVVTSGIVTAVDFDGFYIQDFDGDGDLNTSDAIFVRTGSFNTTGIDVGDLVEVTGFVQENIPGGSGTGNLSVTRISTSLSSVVEVSAGNSLPTPVLIGQSGVPLPDDVVISDSELPTNLQVDPATFNPEVDAIDFWERFEGMRVTGEDLVAVSPTRVFGSFSSEAFTVANGGDFATPSLNVRGALPLASGSDNTGDQNPERIQLQFDPDLIGSSVPPEVVVGDSLGDVTGVVGYSFGNFEINVTEPFAIRPSGLKPEVTRLQGSRRALTIASYNVLNLSATASDEAQRNLLADQIVNNLGSPFIIGLQEIQDNTGTTNNGETDATETLQALVDAIAAAGGPVYQFGDIAPPDGGFGGAPGGNIRNAYLWDPSRVSLLLPLQFVEDAAFDGSRKPLVGIFSFANRTVFVVNNHWTSRFGSSPVFGGPQPFVQAGEQAREAQAQALSDAINDLLTDYPNARVVSLGDHNTFDFTNDLTDILPGPGNVVRNLIGKTTDDAYTFIFDGNAQALDHVFVTPNLEPSAQLDIVHVNNDFVRDDNRIFFGQQSVASDHEPLVARIQLSGKPPRAKCVSHATIVLDDTGVATIDPALLDKGSFDRDGGPISLEAVPSELSCESLGRQRVFLRAIDSSADFDECRSTVIVEAPSGGVCN